MSKRYVRFMGIKELRKYLRGEKLENHTKWIWGSIGFCFFDTSVEPEKRMDYLTGVVDMQVVVEFERVAGPRMRKAYGVYRDTEKDDLTTFPPATQFIREYSVEEYSQDTMRLVRVGYVADPWERKIAWMEEAE